MRWLNWADKSTATILWSCLACSGGGQFIDDGQGRADHQARFGHLPAPGRPLAPVMAVGE
jgi:hypothetical protein